MSNLRTDLNESGFFRSHLHKPIREQFEQAHCGLWFVFEEVSQHIGERFGEKVLVLAGSPLVKSEKQVVRRRIHTHSHSIVAGGLLLMSYTTRFTPFTSLMTRVEMRASSSYGRCAQ